METICDILREMRRGTIPKHRHDRELLLKYAHRIEAAVKALKADRDNWRRQALEEDARANEAQSVTDCNQLGNAAKMRETLEEISNLADAIYTHNECANENSLAILSMCDAALSAPARNCDLYATEADAYRGWELYYASIDKLEDDYLDYEDWLFAEAKEETE
jgi:hypothetical protein